MFTSLITYPVLYVKYFLFERKCMKIVVHISSVTKRRARSFSLLLYFLYGDWNDPGRTSYYILTTPFFRYVPGREYSRIFSHVKGRDLQALFLIAHAV